MGREDHHQDRDREGHHQDREVHSKIVVHPQVIQEVLDHKEDTQAAHLQVTHKTEVHLQATLKTEAHLQAIQATKANQDLPPVTFSETASQIL